MTPAPIAEKAKATYRLEHEHDCLKCKWHGGMGDGRKWCNLMQRTVAPYGTCGCWEKSQ